MKHTEHWNHVGNIAFCKVMGFWEFYYKKPDGTIRALFFIKETQLKGFGRARAQAKKLAKLYSN